MSEDRSDAWDAARYERFRDQRERPAFDLLDRLDPVPGGRAVDLGCGNGRYTVVLHDRLELAETLGLDTSASMLADALDRVVPGVRFERRDLTTVDGEWDVIFANASLQWVPGHLELLPELVSHLAPGGQLAFQVPANFDHPSHTVADEIGRDFGLEPLDRTIGAATPARYAEVLHATGLRELDVTLRIYGHEMERTDEVIAWVSGTLLTAFESRLDRQDHERFRERYTRTLLERLGDPDGDQPYYYAFPRILCSGRLPA